MRGKSPFIRREADLSPLSHTECHCILSPHACWFAVIERSIDHENIQAEPASNIVSAFCLKAANIRAGGNQVSQRIRNTPLRSKSFLMCSCTRHLLPGNRRCAHTVRPALMSLWFYLGRFFFFCCFRYALCRNTCCSGDVLVLKQPRQQGWCCLPPESLSVCVCVHDMMSSRWHSLWRYLPQTWSMSSCYGQILLMQQSGWD